MNAEVIEERRLVSEEGIRFAEKSVVNPLPDLEFTQYGPGRVVYPKLFGKYTEFFRGMEVRADDHWVITFPKSGTTWAQEMVWLLCNNLDYETAKSVLMKDRFPCVESGAFHLTFDSDESKPRQNSMEIVDTAPRSRPRFIKSHLPLTLLPRQLLEVKPKIVYVARNPKDVCVSFYHFYVLFFGFRGTLQDFAEAFVTDSALCSPYWPNVDGFYQLHQKNHPNLLFLTYEDMKRDLKSVIRETAGFLGQTVTDEEVDNLSRHLSFDQMKDNPTVNWEKYGQVALERHKITPTSTKFMRKGEVGSWKKEISAELSQKFDDWIEKNKPEGWPF